MRSMRYTAILTLAVAGAAFVGSSSWGETPSDRPGEEIRQGIDQSQDRANQAIRGATEGLRSSDNRVDAKTASDIQSRLASIVNNAVSTNGFDDVIGSLTKEDRDRLGLDRYKDYSFLNSRIRDFRRAFRDKYHQDFDLKSARFDDLVILRGPDKDHATVTLGAYGPAPRLEGGERVQDRTYREDQPYRSDAWSSRTGIRPENRVAIGNPRGVDKKMDKVNVTVVEPDGTIDRDRLMKADRVRNPDLLPRNVTPPPADVAIGPRIRADESTQTSVRNPAGAQRDTGVALSREGNARPSILEGYASEEGGVAIPRQTVTGERVTVQPGSTTVEPGRVTVEPGTVEVQGGTTPGGTVTPGSDNLSVRPGMLAPISLSLVNEGAVGNGWRLDIPGNASGRQLADSLSSHIKALTDSQASWPNDINQAYRLVSQHVFQALENPRVNISSER